MAWPKVPARGDAVVEYDGERLTVNGRKADRNALTQARAVRDFIRDLLYVTTGKWYPVTGVVLFPGWYVQGPKDKSKSDVWVLNPKGFLAFRSQGGASDDAMPSQ